MTPTDETFARRNGSAYFYANVCTITGPATTVAGPMSRGAKLFLIYATPRLFDSSAPAWLLNMLIAVTLSPGA
jgi:hypothetical protein